MDPYQKKELILKDILPSNVNFVIHIEKQHDTYKQCFVNSYDMFKFIPIHVLVCLFESMSKM